MQDDTHFRFFTPLNDDVEYSNELPWVITSKSRIYEFEALPFLTLGLLYVHEFFLPSMW